MSNPINNFQPITPFQFYCQKVLPLVYDDSLSYYETLCKLSDKLNEVIKNTNSLSESFQELVKQFESLKVLIDNKLEEYTNTQLEKWLTDGTFAKLINQQLLADINKQIAQINTNLDTKANKTDVNSSVDNLQTQINNIVISSSGDSNPEVIQARSAFKTINDRITFIQNSSITSSSQLFIPSQSEDGIYYKYPEGKIEASNAYTTNFIDVSTYEFLDIFYPTGASGTNVSNICYFDENKVPIYSNSFKQPSPNTWYTIKINKGFKYISISFYSAQDKNNVSIYGYNVGAIEQIANLKNDIENNIYRKLETSSNIITPYKCDNPNNSTAYIVSLPWVFKKFDSDLVLTEISFNANKKGILTFGIIYMDEPTETSPKNFDTILFTIDVDIIGQLITYNLESDPRVTKYYNRDNKLYVPSNAYLAVGNSKSDNVTWYFNAPPLAGDTVGFYSPSYNPYNFNKSCLGITVKGYKPIKGNFGNDDFNKLITSQSLLNKNISILGDSISTFVGYIPSGNATYYPAGNVQNVTQTWWYKLINDGGGSLLVNNSWSGSRLTGTGESSGFARADKLDNGQINPDIIIIYLGTNDYIGNVPIGTYDGTQPFPTDSNTIRSAYARVLQKAMTKYQGAKFYIATIMNFERNGEIGFPEKNSNNDLISDYNNAIKDIASLFGCQILDLYTCGINYFNLETMMIDYNAGKALHPNVNGMELMSQLAKKEIN